MYVCMYYYIMYNINYVFYYVHMLTDEEFDETQFDGMLQELVEVIDERDNIVKQVEQDRVR